MEEVRGGEGKVRGGGKEEKGKDGGKELRQRAGVGATPFLELPAEGWRAYRNGGRGGSAGGLMIYLDPGAPVPVSR